MWSYESTNSRGGPKLSTPHTNWTTVLFSRTTFLSLREPNFFLFVPTLLKVSDISSRILRWNGRGQVYFFENRQIRLSTNGSTREPARSAKSCYFGARHRILRNNFLRLQPSLYRDPSPNETNRDECPVFGRMAVWAQPTDARQGRPRRFRFSTTGYEHHFDYGR